MIRISLAILVAFSSFQLKAASIYQPLSSGELISANTLNIRFLEIKTKLSNKLINVNLETFNDNEIIKAEKINMNINTLKNEGVSLSNINTNAAIKASDINALFSELNNFVDNQVIYLVPNSSAYYNIFTATGNRTDKVRVILNIRSGIDIYSHDANWAAMTTGSGWHNESKIEIHNSGRILGMGGNGGQGGISSTQNLWYPGFQGQKGGNALEVHFPIKLNNIGIIFSGGGGGSSAPSFHGRNVAACGGGGGGGQGYGTSAGGPIGYCIPGYSPGRTAGTNGNINTIGYGGNSGYSSGFTSGAGGNGGAWGSPGNDSAWSTAGAPWGNGYPTAGGAAGIAVKSNGHAVTWLSGNNASQVRGPIN